LDAVDGQVALGHEVCLNGLRPAAAEIKVVLRRADFVGVALNRDEIALSGASLCGDELIEGLFGLVRELRGIKFEEYGSFAGGFVVIEIGDAVVQVIAQVAFHLVSLFRGCVGAAQGVGRTGIRAGRLFVGGAESSFVFFLSLLDVADFELTGSTCCAT